jgi:hypothetical protein
MPPRFSLNIDLTLGVNAPLMSYVLTMIHQFIYHRSCGVWKTSDSWELLLHGYHAMDLIKK